MADYDVRHLEDLASAGGAGLRMGRTDLGIAGFGLAIQDLPPHAEDFPDFSHRDPGVEEVYVVLHGNGVMRVDGVEETIGEGTIVRLGVGTTPELRPGPQGLRLLVIARGG